MTTTVLEAEGEIATGIHAENVPSLRRSRTRLANFRSRCRTKLSLSLSISLFLSFSDFLLIGYRKVGRE